MKVRLTFSRKYGLFVISNISFPNILFGVKFEVRQKWINSPFTEEIFDMLPIRILNAVIFMHLIRL